MRRTVFTKWLSQMFDEDNDAENAEDGTFEAFDDEEGCYIIAEVGDGSFHKFFSGMLEVMRLEHNTPEDLKSALCKYIKDAKFSRTESGKERLQ